MKFTLSICFLFCFSANLFANTRQTAWRWRNNDGTETSATWKAPVNTSYVMSSRLAPMRLRILTNWDPASCCGQGFTDKLEYSVSNTLGPWTQVTTSTANAFALTGTNTYLADNASTTSQIGKAGYTFNAGKALVSSPTVTYSSGSNQFTENEWIIRGTATTVTNLTYYFRESNTGMVYDTYPSLVTAAILPVKWISFTATGRDNTVTLEWVTSVQPGNDRFEIMRSADGITWKKIGSVKANRTSAPDNYTFYDGHPISRTNFYRIDQYDLDGATESSEIRKVQMADQSNTIIEIYPNPAIDGVSFSILNKDLAVIEATLVNTLGVLMHKEIFKNIRAQALNRLKMDSKPPAGVYLLKLVSGDILQTKQVIIR